MNDFEPIATRRLQLRPYRPDDAEQLLAYYSNPQVARFLLHGPWDRQEAAAQAEKRSTQVSLSRGDQALALVVELEGVLIGDVALWTTDDTGRRAEAGWIFHPDHGGHGYAVEAMTALYAFAFNEGNLHRIVARMDARNTGSSRLCERLGMTLEGRLRLDLWTKGEWVDTLIYGVLASDGPPSREVPPTTAHSRR